MYTYILYDNFCHSCIKLIKSDTVKTFVVTKDFNFQNATRINFLKLSIF